KKFIWDGQNYLAETDETGATQGVYTLEPRGYGNLISQWQASGPTSLYHHFDGLDSTRRITDSNQAGQANYVYHAFGEQLNFTVPYNPFRFVGQLGYYYDPEVSDYYVRARHYSPPLARWLSAD